MSRMTVQQARRVALAAQGFADPRPTGQVTARHVRRVIGRVHVIQVDSVNVLARAHYLPFLARLGPYDRGRLDALRDGPGPRSRQPRELLECWAHEASLVPPEVWVAHAPRMAAAARRRQADAQALEAEHPGVLEAVVEAVRTGPLTAREVEALLGHDQPRSKEHWGWNWSAVKRALEIGFATGRVTSAGRNQHFERRYCTPDWCVAPQHLARAVGGADPISADDAVLDLVRRSVRAVGVGTRLCIRDYFRLRERQVRPALEALVASGEVEVIEVPGWSDEVFLDAAAKCPRKVEASALLSPFDSLIWQRERTEALWGMRYRIGIYTPAHLREHGYYVLPFLHDEALVARVDLKADRAAGRLRVQQLTWEPGQPTALTQAALGERLAEMARWLGLDAPQL